MAGGVTVKTLKALKKLSLVGGKVVCDAELDMNTNQISDVGNVDGVDVSGLGGGLATLADWSSRPSGVRLLPSPADNTATSYAFSGSAGGLTIKANGIDTYGGGDYFVNPLGFALAADNYGAVDFSIDLDTFSGQDNLTSSGIWHVFLCMVLGGTDKKGTWCGLRLFYQYGATNEVQLRKCFKPTAGTAHTASNSVDLGADFSGDRAAIRLQIKWDSAQGFKAYYDNAATTGALEAEGTEIGSGSVATGFVQPTVSTSTASSADAYRAPTGATIMCAIGQNQDKSAGDASVCRITALNIHSAS
tara:strand:+ start:10780 stop:11688 length:909 start_codon:yes stop_codon:yes gene_type:complete